MVGQIKVTSNIVTQSNLAVYVKKQTMRNHGTNNRRLRHRHHPIGTKTGTKGTPLGQGYETKEFEELGFHLYENSTAAPNWGRSPGNLNRKNNPQIRKNKEPNTGGINAAALLIIESSSSNKITRGLLRELTKQQNIRRMEEINHPYR